MGWIQRKGPLSNARNSRDVLLWRVRCISVEANPVKDQDTAMITIRRRAIVNVRLSPTSLPGFDNMLYFPVFWFE